MIGNNIYLKDEGRPSKLLSLGGKKADRLPHVMLSNSTLQRKAKEESEKLFVAPFSQTRQSFNSNENLFKLTGTHFMSTGPRPSCKDLNGGS